MHHMLDGFVVKAQSGLFTVQTEQGPIVCTLRGRLKRLRSDSNLAAVGDRVTIRVSKENTGVICDVAPRERALTRRTNSSKSRRKPFYRDRPLEQVILANPDQALFVFSCSEPAPRLGMLDRFLVVAEANEIPAIVCANKVDLVGGAAARDLFGLYAQLGYRVQYCSATTGEGVEALKERLENKLSVLAGPSGAGKTSLLNEIQPGLGLSVKPVSTATSKGRHTTVYPQLTPLDGGGWVADTPGLRSMALFDIEAEELDGYFVELAPLVSGCEFSDCSHIHEAGCAVIAAVERGAVHIKRYESYRRMWLGETDA